MAAWMIRWVFGRNATRDQRLRIRRFLMSLSSYSMWFGIAWLCMEYDLLAIERGLMAGIGLLLLASQMAFYFLIRSDLNLHFEDASMTFAQIILGLAWSLVLIAYAREIRGVFLAVFMITLLFGIFALSKRQFVTAALFGFLGYAGLSVVERMISPGLFSDGFYIISVGILGGVLLWTTLFGSYVSDLRYRLSARNQDLEKALEQIRVLAEHDELTGLFNRRYVMASLRREVSRHDRTDSTFSVILIDLDHFKQVNDKFGHSAGDRVLKEFSKSVEKQIRGVDIVAQASEAQTFGRYGGEEFIVLLPDAGLKDATMVAERLRKKQEELLAEHGSVPHVTLSAGVAEYVPGESVESLLRRADQALYEAKYDGRNRVCSARI